MLPVWRERPDDLERLHPIRRVFHTLKGSGRLVGARALGEFSWNVENMITRVLDGTRAASHAVVAVVPPADQKSGVTGQSVAARVVLGCPRQLKNKQKRK